MKLKKPTVFTLVVLFAIVICTTANAVQYIYYNHGCASCVIQINNGLYITNFTAAKEKWNNTNTSVDISTTTVVNGTNSCIEYAVQDTWYGLYTPQTYNWAGRATRFQITLNNTALSGKSSTFRLSVLVHELGHAFCLDDNPSTGNNSIMNYDRNRNYLTWPTTNDEAGVNYAYGS